MSNIITSRLTFRSMFQYFRTAFWLVDDIRIFAKFLFEISKFQKKNENWKFLENSPQQRSACELLTLWILQQCSHWLFPNLLGKISLNFIVNNLNWAPSNCWHQCRQSNLLTTEILSTKNSLFNIWFFDIKKFCFSKFGNFFKNFSEFKNDCDFDDDES